MRPIDIVVRVCLALSLGFSAIGCISQSRTLSNVEINNIIENIDTLSGKRNYHVLLQTEDNKAFQVHIWINNRLGDYMYEDAGMNICRLYTLAESNVFIYEFKECQLEIPTSLLVNRSTYQYAYLEDSPFHEEFGFYQAFWVERKGSKLIRKELEFMEDPVVTELLEKYRE